MKTISSALSLVCFVELLLTTPFPASLRAAPVPNLSPPPPGALVLFDGTNTTAWVDAADGAVNWPVTQGALEVNPQGNTNSIRTASVLQDFRLHAEFLVPKGGNSGIFLQSRYEIQISDSSTNGILGSSDCGAIFGMRAPDANAGLGTNTWQSFDIVFRAARWSGASKIADARVTLDWNSVRVHNDIALTNRTDTGDVEGPGAGTLLLQDLGSRVRFRNIWCQPVPSVLAGPVFNPANGHRYYLLDSNNWSAAEAEAVALGGHLATINEVAEQDWVFANFGAPGRALWIGLTDQAVEGQFRWSSGEPVSYLNWAPGEPNNLFSGTENFTQIYPPEHTRAGLWNDARDRILAQLVPGSNYANFGVAEIPSSSTNAPYYFTDFENGAGPEWSRTNISLTPVGGRRFLGDFSNEVVRFSLANLPMHTSARVTFDLFILRSWDGNGDSCCGPDVWSLREEGGQTLLQTTFSNTGDSANRQAYPGSFTQSSVPAQTGAAEINTLGFQYPSTGGAVRDAVYPISIPFKHFGDSLALLFSAARLQGLTNESWGLDNVSIRLGNENVPVPSNVFLVEPGANWKYLDNGSNQGTSWIAPTFNDSMWASGPAELGYGDNNATDQRPEVTVLSFGPNVNAKYITTYFRRAFSVSNITNVISLTVGLLRDDGGVVYLNGLEIFRSNLPNGPVNSSTLATNATDDGKVFFTNSVNPALLVEGTNVLAVEIHQTSATSTDISFDLYLHAKVAPSILNTNLLLSLARSNRLVSLSIFATPGQSVLIDRSAGLSSPPTWTNWTNLILPVSPYTISDPDSTNVSQRFYRGRLP